MLGHTAVRGGLVERNVTEREQSALLGELSETAAALAVEGVGEGDDVALRAFAEFDVLRPSDQTRELSRALFRAHRGQSAERLAFPVFERVRERSVVDHARVVEIGLGKGVEGGGKAVQHPAVAEEQSALLLAAARVRERVLERRRDAAHILEGARFRRREPLAVSQLLGEHAGVIPELPQELVRLHDAFPLPFERGEALRRRSRRLPDIVEYAALRLGSARRAQFHELHFEVVRAVQKVVVAARIHRFHAAYIALLFARPLFAVIKRHGQPRYRGRRQRDDRAHKRSAHLLFCRSLLLRLCAFVLVAGGGTVARPRGLFPFAHMLLLINRNCGRLSPA